eukprot:g755.t1
MEIGIQFQYFRCNFELPAHEAPRYDTAEPGPASLYTKIFRSLLCVQAKRSHRSHSKISCTSLQQGEILGPLLLRTAAQDVKNMTPKNWRQEPFSSRCEAKRASPETFLNILGSARIVDMMKLLGVCVPAVYEPERKLKIPKNPRSCVRERERFSEKLGGVRHANRMVLVTHIRMIEMICFPHMRTVDMVEASSNYVLLGNEGLRLQTGKETSPTQTGGDYTMP